MLRSNLKLFALGFFSAVIGFVVVQSLSTTPTSPISYHAAPVHLSSNQSTSSGPSVRAARSTAGPSVFLPDFRGAADRAVNAVVHVRTAQSVSTGNRWHSWYDFFQTPDERRILTGSGSGVILDSEGHIVTNQHVIEGADAVEIVLNDNRSFTAEIVGSDPTTDIAVLKVDAEGITGIDWGDSDEVRVGDWVLAVGNPFDLVSTVTAGIVSAKARDIQLLRPDFDRSLFPIESFIQTDAAVNPGNSGGALVDTEGRLIGINTAIASKTGSYAGYAFAVPANLAKKVASDLIEFGSVQRAYLGVNIRPVDASVANSMGLPSVSGVFVADVTKNSGAVAAGIRAGDVITAVGETPISTLPQLLEKVNQYRPGQKITVDVWRDGNVVSMEVELGTREGIDRYNSDPEGNNPTRNSTNDEADGKTLLLGCQIRNAPRKEGVEVLNPGQGAFARSGIPPGTIIVAADGNPISDTQDLIEAIEQVRKNGTRGILLEGKNTKGETKWFGLDLKG